jgi:hypothetical protein
LRRLVVARLGRGVQCRVFLDDLDFATMLRSKLLSGEFVVGQVELVVRRRIVVGVDVDSIEDVD